MDRLVLNDMTRERIEPLITGLPGQKDLTGRDNGLREHIVDPVFRQIKAARGFRQLLLHGVEKVTCEWALICTAHLAKPTA